MAGFSDYLEHELLDHVYRNAAYAQPANVYIGLYTTAPTDAGGGVEVSGGSYSRQVVTFGAPAAGQVVNSVVVDFGSATADWGLVTHFGIFDLASAGNLLTWDSLSASKTIQNGDPVSIPLGDLTVTLD